MVPVRGKEGIVLRCGKCGYEVRPKGKASLVLRKRVRHSVRDRIIVIEGEQPRVLPKTKALCPKCGNNEAFYWMVQTRAGDEPPTRFFKCTKCGFVWREYD